MRLLHCLLASLSFLAVYFLAPVEREVAAGLAILVMIAWLWLTEALHVSVTALLVPLLATATGIFTLPKAVSHFADPIIFLFLGGFALAAGLRQQGLDRWMASWVMQKAGGELGKAARWLFALTALLSMWISNTATAAMMLPLALGLLAPLEMDRYRSTWIYVLLGVAFSANIGGIGTLVGSPPNAIAASAMGISFGQWLLWGLPLVVVFLPAMDMMLRWVLKPALKAEVSVTASQVEWTGRHTGMLLVFLLTVVLWVAGAPLGKLVGIESGYDSAVALLALILLHTFALASWREIEKSADWGVLLLFGGGITLSAALGASGAGEWLAQLLGGAFSTLPPLLVIGLMILFALALTEVASNTASAALLIPLFTGMVPEISPLVIAVMIAVATSCAFLLPVATPPNAIIFGSGKVPQRSMIINGSWVTLLIFPLLILAAGVGLLLG
ncbi:solute carrier family 13 (sodium-dependent dicarboxylate transporter), member 2/3/5 [Marinospirillum celere]|uniref:Solute carrier family 13 (Sodium-dependent dicarboxylate transporter), member 2/3/5 n=1 Tax=Marinospirillum celere TaxID=1122252 RepID=A0A1I1EMM9_9GAMM|nr:DASS family sodium-coupled anion symporter [Marinospirillum celere]SFB86163.1 solute carrier family 13 (sodium-dependent dicarboxylate transporter), member 2/3/5 [Marinospirillum celere]